MTSNCEEPPAEHFIERVSNYPVVSDAYGKVSDYYCWAKGKSSLMKTGLDYAESTLQCAASKARPVIHRLDTPISALDKFSCRQLDKLEEKCPVIREPTEQIFEKTMDLYETGVKPRVCGLVNPIIKPVSTTYSAISGGVSAVTRKSVSTVVSLSTTPPGKVAMSRLSDALDLADRSVDKFLPNTEESSVDQAESPSATIKCSEQDQITPNKLALRAGCLTTKVRRRMYSRAMRDIKQLKLRSEEAVKKMTHSVDLIAYARTHLDASKEYSERLTCEWRNAMYELEGREEDSEESEDEDDDVEIDEAAADPELPVRHQKADRLLASARFWAHRLRLATVAMGMVGYRHLPTVLQTKLDVATETANNLHHQLSAIQRVQDLQQSFSEYARNAINLVNEHITLTFDYLTTTSVLSWLSPKSSPECIEMQSLNPVRDSEGQERLSPQEDGNNTKPENSVNEFCDREDLE